MCTASQITDRYLFAFLQLTNAYTVIFPFIFEEVPYNILYKWECTHVYISKHR